MRVKAKLFTAAALIAAAASPASATIPVIDPAAIARIREVVATASKQLAAAKEQVSQVQQMRSTIGQVGKGQIGSILQNSGLNLNGADGSMKDIRTLSLNANSLGQSTQKLKINGESGFSVPNSISSIDDGRQAAGKIFFFNGSSAMNQEQIAGLRQRRNSMLRETAITSYGAATALRSGLDETRQTAEKLAEQAKAAPDLRTDVQVSTAVMLAMYAELQKQTAMSAQSLELEAAKVLSGDATGRISQGN